MKVLLTLAPWYTNNLRGMRAGRWPHLTEGKKGACFPFFLASTAAVLRENGNEVRIIDAVAKNMDKNKYLNEIREYGPDAVVIESTAPSIEWDLWAAKKIKNEFKVPIVFVGTHPTIFADELLKNNSFIDFICRGEYEYTVRDLIISLGKKTGQKRVLGITYRENEKIIKNKDRPIIEDLDELPFPAHDLLDLDDYSQPSFLKERYGRMYFTMSSRGCPFNCAFCVWPQTLFGRKIRERSVKAVVDEIELAVKKYNAGHIWFDDDTFAINKKRVLEICDCIEKKKLDIKWGCMSRVDVIDEELLKKMYNAGCRFLEYGVETGSQKMQKRIKKNLDLKKVEEVFKLTKKNGIFVDATFMIGLPGETEKTATETINLIKKLDFDGGQVSIAIPFPGSEFYKEVKKNNLLLTNDWSDFSGSTCVVSRTEELSKEDIQRLFNIAKDALYSKNLKFSSEKMIFSLKQVKSPDDLIVFSKKSVRFIKHFIKNKTSKSDLNG